MKSAGQPAISDQIREKIMSTAVVDVKQLCFKYTLDERRALTLEEVAKSPNVLRNVCFSLPAASRTVLIGENGAGKSTLLRLLAGRTKATGNGGSIQIAGYDPYTNNGGEARLLDSDWINTISSLSNVKVAELMDSAQVCPEATERLHMLAALMQIQPGLAISLKYACDL